MWRQGARRTVSPFVQGLRRISTGNVAFQAVPASLSAQSSGGWLSSLFGGSSGTGISMTNPFPGFMEPARENPASAAPSTELTTLPNGFRVATENSWGPTSCVALVVGSGSIHEQPHVAGVSHLLEYMAFKSTLNRTHFRIMNEVSGFGGNVMAAAAREQMYYSIDCLRSHVPEALEVLCDCVLNPKFVDWEVKDAVARLKEDLENMKKNPQIMMTEALQSAAYQGALGSPLIASESTLHALTPKDLHDFVAKSYTAPRMVLAAAGAEHGDVLRIVEPMLSTATSGEKPVAPSSTYVGGETRLPTADPMAHVILAFDSPGGWQDVKAASIMTVLLYMMGGGGSFSAGGPGKGMHSRLYLNVLTRYNWVNNFSAINTAFDDRCLAGVYGAAPAEYGGQLVDIMVKELQSLAATVNEEELDRAKTAAVGTVLMTLEGKAVVAEDIGKQILTYGHRKSTKEFCDALSSVTANDITSMVASMLRSPPCMVAMGSIAGVPRCTDIAKRFC